jgi:hypothetical protein
MYIQSAAVEAIKFELFRSLFLASGSLSPRLTKVLIIGRELDSVNEALQESNSFSVRHFPLSYAFPSEERHGVEHLDLDLFSRDFDLVVDFSGQLSTQYPSSANFRTLAGTVRFIDGSKYLNDFFGLLGVLPAALSTCFSFRKICFVYASLILTDAESGPVFEGGVFFGGNTLFMSKTLSALSSKRVVYSFDTFEGMPPPLAEDSISTTDYYREGHFSEATLERTRHFLQQNGVAVDGRLFKARVGEVFEFSPLIHNASLAVLDMDSYEGIFWGLKHLAETGSPRFLALIDDTSLPGVSTAIERVARAYRLQRTEVTKNVELVCRIHSQ